MARRKSCHGRSFMRSERIPGGRRMLLAWALLFEVPSSRRRMLTRDEFSLKSAGPNHDETRSDVGAVDPTTDAPLGAYHDRYKEVACHGHPSVGLRCWKA